VSAEQPGPRWHFLLRPKWLCWHLFIVLATLAMLWLGDWQLQRAEAGNELSWAYTFEWPIFAVFAVVFWVRSLRDELRAHAPGAQQRSAGETQGQPARPDQPDWADQPDQAPVGSDGYVARLKAEVQGHGRWHGFR